jgi:hypothetical protein
MSVQKFNPAITSESSVPFTMVPNNVIEEISDCHVGWVWLYLQKKSSNWEVVKSHIKTKFKIGDDRIKKIFAHMHKVGLLEYRRERDERGRLKKVEIKILNGSKFNPLGVNQSTGVKTTRVENHTCGSRGLLNKDKAPKKDKASKKELATKNLLPENFCFDEAHKKIAATYNLDIELELAKFKIRLKNKKSNDWAAEFSLWLWRAHEFKNPRWQRKIEKKEEVFSDTSNQSTSWVSTEESIKRDRLHQQRLDESIRNGY